MDIPEKVAGLVENTCKQCGKKFAKAYFEGESPEMGKGDYCLPCIMGVDSVKTLADELLREHEKANMSKLPK